MRLGRMVLVFLLVFAGAAGAGENSTDDLVSELAARASRVNLVNAPQRELDECMRLLPERLRQRGYKGGGISLSGTHDYVLFMSWGVGWDSLMFSYAGKDQHGGGVFAYTDEDGQVFKHLPGSDIQALISGLSTDEWKYSFMPGVQDGSCELLVVRKGNEEAVVLVPPGGQIYSDKGDPREFINEWTGRNL